MRVAMAGYLTFPFATGSERRRKKQQLIQDLQDIHG
jgi:hypothetical protein